MRATLAVAEDQQRDHRARATDSHDDDEPVHPGRRRDVGHRLRPRAPAGAPALPPRLPAHPTGSIPGMTQHYVTVGRPKRKRKAWLRHRRQGEVRTCAQPERRQKKVRRRRLLRRRQRRRQKRRKKKRLSAASQDVGTVPPLTRQEGHHQLPSRRLRCPHSTRSATRAAGPARSMHRPRDRVQDRQGHEPVMTTGLRQTSPVFAVSYESPDRVLRAPAFAWCCAWTTLMGA